MGSHLPYDAEIEYLESSGTQYIDISFFGTTTTTIYIKFETTYLTGSNAYGIFGYRKAVRENAFSLMQYNEGGQLFRWDYGSELNHIKPVSSGWHIASTNGNSMDLDGTIAAGGQLSIAGAMYLFAINQNGTVFIPSKHLKISSFKLYKSGSLTLDLIPVRKGQIGYMYDKVSGQLFGNAGTGQFILGSDR
jgi:hypothetical protein